MNINNQIGHARMLYESGQYDRAKNICKKVIGSDSTNFAALNMLGSMAQMQGDAESAIAFYERSLAINPKQPVVSINVGAMLRHAGKPDQAIPWLRASLNFQLSYRAYLELGLCCIDIEDIQEAKTNFAGALALKPSCWLSARHLSNLLIKENSLDEAERMIEKFIKVDPANPHAYAQLTKVHLMKSDPVAALAVNRENLRVEPAYTRGLALKYVALSELGDPTGAEYLYDYDHLVQRLTAKCPSSFAAIKDFNLLLTEHILNNVNLHKSPKNYTTVNGAHSGFDGIFNNDKQLGECVHEMVLDAVNRYIENLALEADHPINTTKPSEYRILIWAVATERGGHEQPHIHARSWIGGSYYVHLPDDFDSQPSPNAGWIEFGRGETALHRLHEPKTRAYKPVEGDFLIFPGYFWHNTIPLESDGKRVVMAFDVQPIHGWGK